MKEEAEAIGFLIVETVTANGALPVPKAVVHVFEYDENGGGDAIYTLRTDVSGRTDKLALDAKSKELSLSPESVKPYTAYSLTVDREGYYSSEKINVPIFQGITSIQTVNLIPLSEYSSPDSATPDALGRYTRIPDSNL